MKLLSILLTAGLLAIGITACGRAAKADEKAATSYQKITAGDAKAMMDEGSVTIVDVRTAEEYAGGHVPDAVNVPNESIQDAAPDSLPQKDAVLLVYCRSGRRSAEASQKLSGLGYENVYDFGGINDWPYETETASGRK